VTKISQCFGLRTGLHSKFKFRAYGDQVAMRSAEDIAYAVLRFFAKGGSMVNYYMYHGGTNFGRTGASYVLTGYYDEAPMDEYG